MAFLLKEIKINSNLTRNINLGQQLKRLIHLHKNLIWTPSRKMRACVCVVVVVVVVVTFICYLCGIFLLTAIHIIVVCLNLLWNINVFWPVLIAREPISVGERKRTRDRDREKARELGKPQSKKTKELHGYAFRKQWCGK